jgi:hypothetical protein
MDLVLIWDFHGYMFESGCLLVCYNVQSGRYLPDIFAVPLCGYGESKQSHKENSVQNLLI